ncbi:MAG: hypothetical protein Q9159_000702 [Coniocarpon cinnabarinum]
MEPERNATNGYFVEPYSAFDIDHEHRAGLIVLGVLGILSVTTLLPVIMFIVLRLFRHPQIAQNQPVILCFNLLLADLFQATSFLASFHWVTVGSILAPSGWCHVQGALLNLGDCSSGFFVLFIALHTGWTIVQGQSLSQRVFASITVFIWIFAVVLTIVGPIHFGQSFFVRAGNWCWISPTYESERLGLHYLWTFINEFGTIVIYALIFFYLNRKLKKLRKVRPDLAASKSIGRATKYMILYPLVFVIATLPLAVGRMLSANKKTPSDQYFFGAGALLASCGWLDAVLYTFTRRVLLKSGPGGDGSSYPAGSSHKPATFHGFGYGSNATGGGTATSPFPFSSGNRDRESKTLSGITFEMPSKAATAKQRGQSDEVELLALKSNESRTNTMDSSVTPSGVATWPLPPATSPAPEDESTEPIQRRTMVRIEEEPAPGRAPRKYWRMEPVHSAFE